MALRPPVLKRDDYRRQIQGPRCTEIADDVDRVVQVSDGGVDDPADDKTYTKSQINVRTTS
jgi:hypothetical protein